MPGSEFLLRGGGEGGGAFQMLDNRNNSKARIAVRYPAEVTKCTSSTLIVLCALEEHARKTSAAPARQFTFFFTDYRMPNHLGLPTGLAWWQLFAKTSERLPPPHYSMRYFSDTSGKHGARYVLCFPCRFRHSLGTEVTAGFLIAVSFGFAHHCASRTEVFSQLYIYT